MTSPEEHLNQPNHTESCIRDCTKNQGQKIQKKQKIEKTKNICALYQIDLLDVKYCVNMYFVINFLP